MTVPGQPPYELIQKNGDLFTSPGLPESFAVRAERDSGGKVVAMTLIQPNGEFRMERVGGVAKVDNPSADSIIAKAISALGGEAAWKSLDSRIVELEIDFENQGVKGSGTTHARQPFLYASKTEMFALGRKIGDAFEYLNGSGGGAITSFLPPEIHGVSRLAELKTEYGFYGLLDAINGTHLSVLGSEKIREEEVWVVEFKSAGGSNYRMYFSKNTSLPVRRFSTVSSSTSTIKLPVTVDYSDYREIDGVKIPFRTLTASPSMGNIVTTIKSVVHNVKIPDETFFPKR
jgi:hypothetical protein